MQVVAVGQLHATTLEAQSDGSLQLQFREMASSGNGNVDDPCRLSTYSNAISSYRVDGTSYQPPDLGPCSISNCYDNGLCFFDFTAMNGNHHQFTFQHWSHRLSIQFNLG